MARVPTGPDSIADLQLYLQGVADKPREAFWQKRQAEQTGQRPYRRRR
jgi:hypothetical protein